jgi:hypothetical protein
MKVSNYPQIPVVNYHTTPVYNMCVWGMDDVMLVENKRRWFTAA